MVRSSPWAATRLRIEVIIDGFHFEAVQFISSFQLNSIPTCSIMVAVGRSVKTLKKAAVHDHFKNIKVQSSVEVYISPQHMDASGADIPHEWHESMIFKGQVTGVGWKRSTSGAQFVIHAEHFCAAFNYSSSLSGGSHPSNQAQFSFGAMTEARLINANSGLGEAQWLPFIPRDEISSGNIGEDLWDLVLEKMIRKVAKEPALDERLRNTDDTEKGNGLILNILDDVNSAKMGMNLGGISDTVIDGNIADYLWNKSFGKADFHQTMWGKILQWAGTFWFMVVPRPEEVLIVPNSGPLRGDHWATLKTSDYVQADMNNSMKQLVRCVGISHTVTTSTGFDTSGAVEGAPTHYDLAAVYPPEPPKRGVAIVKEAPDWLADPVLSWQKSRKTVATPDREVVGSQDGADGDGNEMDPKEDIQKNTEDLQSVMQKLAQQWYVIENLAGRYTEISGRLRFDICPGSTVKVEAGSDPFVANDQLQETYYAQVMGVTTAINSEQQRAGTTFSLAFVRTEEENETDEFTVSSPPLYKEGWYGKEMADGYKPDK